MLLHVLNASLVSFLQSDIVCLCLQVIWAVRAEYARRALDVIARRTRIAFVNVAAAAEALPNIVDIMGRELGWSTQQKKVCVSWLE